MSCRDEYWMQQALACAKQAEQAGEVPVGCVIVKDDTLLASGYNQPIGLSDPTAHAEIVALRQAALQLGNYRLLDTTLYVTLEPCVMCIGAILHARVGRLVYAATDPKAGAVESVFQVTQAGLNHQLPHSAGICADQAGQLLKAFFKARRR